MAHYKPNIARRASSPLATRIQSLTKIEHNADLIVADTSGSMDSPSGFSGLSRWDCLKQALEAQGERIAVLAFDSIIVECTASTLPRPRGGTNMAEALDHAFVLEPLHVLVISDGEPNSDERALSSAVVLAKDCIIDVLYIGPGDNEKAISFMRRLAEVGRGRYMAFDLSASKSPLQLTEKVSSLLMLPGPGTIRL